MFDADYINKLKERGKVSHVYKKFQDIGLQLAEILCDSKHKALYIKLAKQYDESLLLSLAKDTAERSNVANKGAYFMKVLHERFPLPKQPKVAPIKTEEQRAKKVLPAKKKVVAQKNNVRKKPTHPNGNK
ncbi:MAG: hypothetical protein UY31_C0009G0015 [Candidatus Wolfebacteria bacterium GW2011_GWE1_48_7]|uniref:Uncharacterized protein n=2 Tax=Candidatus Wolfeibacteriota TaxID=1752735 RepID=A0A0G1X7X5_9BACT|nr:MAG: hypothetical protein UX70_C0001G0459 [Candidatus Wolfebacteria bacterium GW2011_GWB1_47_1]KKU37181.1 MAG: hypothetical protein UX49_C0001G0051 [Candidatus Wolfebacteria bacterium GW2011_GWC2_46_275]KKU42659.1 MAG: hypothetical protein UX58_C0001G0091 [Candidatus Wolfebacteria bacterium GW2011_GWB2_46_69]KKU54606.1 MAG: hypothetical protein UX76_C0001G0065 [Candidatus Wolfebacteria bacterium GW2011_GWC1_47_103]KKU59990.1 MAG: hypothetical protein UX83_C0001G0065 [Candidatus Wolfebacteria